MKKTNGLKRFIAFMTAIMMVLGCISINVFAATSEATWTATKENDILTIKSTNSGRSYKAYQVFCGDESNNVLSNIVWGVSVTEPDKLIEALTSEKLADGRDNTVQHYFNGLTTSSTASDVAAKLVSITDKTADADTFAYIVVTALKAQATCDTMTVSTSKATTNDSSAEYAYSFGAIHDGYYLVEDTTKVGSGEMASRVMVKVNGPTTISTKESAAPTIDKKILKYDEEKKETTETTFDDVAIGDTVTFELKSKVPDMSGYNKFFFIMNDQLSKGLTFDKTNCNMVVKVNGTETDDYYVVVDDEKTPAGGTAFRIVFRNFIQYKNDVDKEIVVTYEATVNDEILVGTTSDNFNKVNLTYSNNPNVSYTGTNANDPDTPPTDPDNPGPGDEPNDTEKTNGSVDTTEDSIVYVYTTALNIIKVSKSTSMRLAGAEFKITGEKLNKVIRKTYKYTPKDYDIETDRSEEVSESENLYYKDASGEFVKNITSKVKEAVKYAVDAEGIYTANPAGSYYMNITNGESNPTWDTAIKEGATYKEGTMIYEQEVTDETITITEDVNLTGVTGDDGTLYIAGLSAGEYLIEEVEAPSGYNLLDHKIMVKVECDVKDTKTMLPTWTFYVDETGVGDSYQTTDIKTLSNGTGELRIENAAGTTLPSTGGMGTTVFYVLGSILMAGAVILLISKRRMNAWNQ